MKIDPGHFGLILFLRQNDCKNRPGKMTQLDFQNIPPSSVLPYIPPVQGEKEWKQPNNTLYEVGIS